MPGKLLWQPSLSNRRPWTDGIHATCEITGWGTRRHDNGKWVKEKERTGGVGTRIDFVWTVVNEGKWGGIENRTCLAAVGNTNASDNPNGRMIVKWNEGMRRMRTDKRKERKRKKTSTQAHTKANKIYQKWQTMWMPETAKTSEKQRMEFKVEKTKAKQRQWRRETNKN